MFHYKQRNLDKYTHSGSSPLIIYPKNLHCLQLKHIYTMGMQFSKNFPKIFALFLLKIIQKLRNSHTQFLRPLYTILVGSKHIQFRYQQNQVTHTAFPYIISYLSKKKEYMQTVYITNANNNTLLIGQQCTIVHTFLTRIVHII